jgi:hypothetical protein
MKSLFTKITCLNLIVCLSVLFGGSSLAGTWSGEILGTGKMIGISGTTVASGTVASGNSKADEPIDWIKVDMTTYQNNGICTQDSREDTNSDFVSLSLSCSNGVYAESEHLWSNWGEIITKNTSDFF